MKYLTLILITATLLLTGCASTLRADVTTFHAWPTDVPDTSYVFERTKEQDDSLEYRNYEDLVRHAVRKLGLNEAEAGKKPSLKIVLDFDQHVADVRKIEPVAVDPFFHGSLLVGHGLYRRGWYGNRYGYGNPGFGIDPYFYGPPAVVYRDVTYQINRRQLHVLISRYLDGKAVYDVHVNSQGQNASLAAVMPYLVRSAFADFPGKSGVTRIIDMKVDN